MTKILILAKVRKGINKNSALDFQRVDFGLSRTLVQGVPWETMLNNKGVEEAWTFFKKEILKVWKLAVPMCQKMSWKGRRPAWLNRELSLELRGKKASL